MSTVTSKISGGKMYCIEFKNFCTLHICRDMEIYGYPPYTNHTEAKRQYGVVFTTGTPPLTRFFGPGKNRVKGKPHYRRSILVLKP